MSTDPSDTPARAQAQAQARAPRRRAPLAQRLLARIKTAGALILHFLHPARFVLAPLLIVLMFGGVLLWLTGGLAYVAPFVYALF